MMSEYDQEIPQSQTADREEESLKNLYLCRTDNHFSINGSACVLKTIFICAASFIVWPVRGF